MQEDFVAQPIQKNFVAQPLGEMVAADIVPDNWTTSGGDDWTDDSGNGWDYYKLLGARAFQWVAKQIRRRFTA